MKLVYVGEAPERAIVVPGGVLPVVRDVPFEVDDILAASLLAQNIYQPAPADKPTKKEQD